MTYDHNNIFARILKGELPCERVWENDIALAFHDIFPAAPLHVLVIPKNPYTCFSHFTNTAPSEEIAAFFQAVQIVISKLDLADGYRLITNQGKNGDQTVPHFHVHILGKKRLGKLLSA